jgi:hypothetical protein
MVIFSGKRPARAGTGPSSRFKRTAGPVAESRGEGLPEQGGTRRAAGGQAGGASVAPMLDGTLSSLDTAFDETPGWILHDAQESLVPDARAGLTPSDLVTHRLAELLK